MRMDSRCAPLSLVLFIAACSGSADPGSAPAATVAGESTFELDSADGAPADTNTAVDAAGEEDASADVDKGRDREGRGARRHRRGHHHHHHGNGGGHAPQEPQEPPPPPPPPEPGQSCEAAGQTFPDGSGVPSGDSCNTCSCSDGSLICTLALCEPVFCALFVEQPDGVCSRFSLDPCISQDPDCTATSE